MPKKFFNQPRTQHRQEQKIPILKKLFGGAEKLHNEVYKIGEKLTPTERNKMSSGLSGILDLTSDAQESCFNNQEWIKSKNHYLRKYRMEAYTTLSQHPREKYFCAKSLKGKTVEAGRKYLDRLCSTATTKDHATYKMLDTILDSVQNCQFLLNPPHPNKVVEGDYAYSNWMPLLKKLFDINKQIRLKVAESVPCDSTNEKIYMYGSDHKNLIGFKVDIRMLYDFSWEEFDLGNLECCLPSANEAKVLGDHGKLVREGRTNTSSLVSVVDNLSVVHTWVIQTYGLKSFNLILQKTRTMILLRYLCCARRVRRRMKGFGD